MFYRGFFSTGFPTELSMETILYRENIKIPFKFKIVKNLETVFELLRIEATLRRCSENSALGSFRQSL